MKSFFNFLKFLIKNKYLLLGILFFISIISIILIKEFLLYKAESEWQLIEREKNEIFLSQISGDVRYFQENIISKCKKIRNDSSLLKILSEYKINGKERYKVFNYLTGLGYDENFEIISSTKKNIAWIGRRNLVPRKQHFEFNSADTSFITSGAIYSYFVHISKIFVTPKDTCYLLSSKIILTNYDLNNRYLRSTGLESELQSKYEIPIKLYLTKTPIPRKGYIISQIQLVFLKCRGIKKNSTWKEFRGCVTRSYSRYYLFS